ncbi:DUF2066 domain-containing protein [Beggiatoa leptomitoformis]|uniref:DUF2066 domain-containing protein n=1 Tax=Beggiatoa leptomitoformis TaxID=288004 RepID=A0A2N9YDI8_9GAMM|nr:DUF2066 domain-containing protein [Beggiatoa leptomitoformis]ALG69145.1 DUF2066 domain-containing protein [Beggiatoa leptomitoformis]AUI68435.1 DUF2066 domain-containing protein [Beggiatoa leptomitoformis]
MYRQLFFCIVWLFFGISVVQAEQPLYEATVPIASRDESLLDDGFTRAFAQLLVDITGDATAPEKFKTLLPKATKLIAQYEYKEQADSKLMLIAGFEPQGVKRLLRSASIPVPQAKKNRPPLLTWIVVEQTEISQILNEDEFATETGMLKKQASQRATPLLFPVLDIEDRSALPLSAVKSAQQSAALSVANRYGAETMLVGWIAKQNNVWQGQWVVYAKNALVSQWNNQNTDLTALLQTTLNEAIEYLNPKKTAPTTSAATTNNAVATPMPSAVDETIEIQITAVDNLQDYMKVNNYLQGLDALRNIQVQNTQQGQVTFKVTIKGGSMALNQLFTNDDVLMASPSSANNNTYRLVK